MITCATASLLSLLVERSHCTRADRTSGGHRTPQSTIGDILRHPAFAGFSRLLLPWDDRAYDEKLPLTRVGSLLPYHITWIRRR